MNMKKIDILSIAILFFLLSSSFIVSAVENDTNSTAIKKGGGGICLPGFSGFDCALVWLIAVLLFFLAAVFRKQVANELLDMPFSLIGATLLSEIVYIIMLLIFHQVKWGLLGGIAGMLIGGFVLNFFGDTESG